MGSGGERKREDGGGLGRRKNGPPARLPASRPALVGPPVDLRLRVVLGRSSVGRLFNVLLDFASTLGAHRRALSISAQRGGPAGPAQGWGRLLARDSSRSTGAPVSVHCPSARSALQCALGRAAHQRASKISAHGPPAHNACHGPTAPISDHCPSVTTAHQPAVTTAHQPSVTTAHQPSVTTAHQPSVTTAHRPLPPL